MKSKRGFTLVEILVVVLLLGLIAVSIVVVSNKKKTQDERKEYQEAIARSAAIYVDKYKGERFSDFNGGGNKDFRYIMLNEIIAEGLLDEEKNNPFIDKNGKCSGTNCDVVEVYYEQNSTELKVLYPTDFQGNVDEETIYICGNIDSTIPQNYYLLDSKSAYDKYKNNSSIINEIQNGNFVYNEIMEKKDSYLDIYLCGYEGIIKNAKLSFRKLDYDLDSRTLKIGVKVDNITDFTSLGYKLIGNFKTEDTKLVKVVDESCPVLLYNDNIYTSSEVTYTGNYDDFEAFDNYDGFINYGDVSITSPDYGFNTPDFTLPNMNSAKGQLFTISRNQASNVSTENRTVILRDSNGTTCSNQYIKFNCQNGLEFNSNGSCACDNSSKCTSDGICRSIASGEIKNSSGVCQCDKLHEYKDGQCVEKTCPNGKKLNSDGNCVCPKGSCIDSNGQCGTCKEHETQETSSEKCTCETGYVSSNGTCTAEFYASNNCPYIDDTLYAHSCPSAYSTAGALNCIKERADLKCEQNTTIPQDKYQGSGLCLFNYIISRGPNNSDLLVNEYHSGASVVYESNLTNFRFKIYDYINRVTQSRNYSEALNGGVGNALRRSKEHVDIIYDKYVDYIMTTPEEHQADVAKNKLTCYENEFNCHYEPGNYRACEYYQEYYIDDTQKTIDSDLAFKRLVERLQTLLGDGQCTDNNYVKKYQKYISDLKKYASKMNYTYDKTEGSFIYFRRTDGHIVSELYSPACMVTNCTSPEVLKNGTCTCEAPNTVVSGKCVKSNNCTSPETLKNGTCTCELPNTVVNGKCTKPAGGSTGGGNCPPQQCINPTINGFSHDSEQKCMVWNPEKCTCEWNGSLEGCH